MMSEADNTAQKVCDAMKAEHAEEAEYFRFGNFHKYRLKDTVWLEQYHKDVLSRHRQQSWYLPGVILRETGQDVYVIQGENNKTVERDHSPLVPRKPDPHGCAIAFQFTADAFESDDSGEEDEYDAERILSDRPDPITPGRRLYNVRWKGFAASREWWEPRSSLVPRYTSVWPDFLKAKIIKSGVKDVLVQLVTSDRD